MPGRAAGARPDIAFFIELDFPSVADTERQWKFNEILGLRVEAIKRVIVASSTKNCPLLASIGFSSIELISG